MAKLIVGINDLATINPKLAAEWHPTKNGELTPEMVAISSHKKVWWLGSCKHEWEATIGNRKKGIGCPFCKHKAVLPGFNDLATLNPKLAAEWHPAKNGELTPALVTACSGKKVWWLGPCKHEWEATISSRKKGTGCPFCTSKTVLPGFNDLASLNPELAAQWHPTKNGELTPAMVTACSGKKVWWLGPCKHEWKAPVCSRQRGTKCPFCNHTAVLPGFNDLASLNPELAAQWHPTKNGELTPTMVTISSSKKVWWLGSCGHEWSTAIYHRHHGGGCPFCNHAAVLPGFNDLATINPKLAAEWHPAKNGALTPTMVTVSSSKKVWWLGSCGHEWTTTIYHRYHGGGCPFCNHAAVLPGFNDLATINPKLAAEWHPAKNGALTPEMVTAFSNKKVWWLGSCGHEWNAVVYSRQRGHKCPFCDNNTVLSGFNDLAALNPKLAAEWHPTKNGALTPEMVIAFSSQKAWWLGSCGHEWNATVYSRQHGIGCPICNGKTVLPGFNDLSTTNPELAAQWHPTKNGALTPEMVTTHSGKKVWWLGSCGHEWNAVVRSRSHTGCPACNGKKSYINKYVSKGDS